MKDMIKALLNIELNELEHQITIMETYLALRMQMRDDHGCFDAAADLKELRAKKTGISQFAEKLLTHG